MYGGAGAGKSYAMAQRVVLSLLQDKKIKWCIIRKVARTIKDSVFTEIVNCINENDLNSYFKINKSDYSIECIQTKSTAIMLGVDDPEKLKSISGIRKIWVEEASDLIENEFNQIDLRLRGESEYTYQVFLTFNPITSTHWLKARFFDKIDPEANVVKATYLNNGFIDEKYRTLLNSYKETSPYHYEVYCLGAWGNLSGQIYSNYDVINSFPDGCEIIYGLDFGFNNPSSLVKVGIKDQEFYIEEILYKSNLTNQDLINELKPLNIKHRIYADSAEPDRIQEIRDAHFTISSSNKNVKDGIDFIKAARLHITSNSTNLIREINEYSWRKDRQGNTVDEPVKFKDHALDAMRYAIYTHCKGHIDIPVIRMSGITYPDKNTKSQTPAEAIATMRRQQQLNRHFR